MSIIKTMTIDGFYSKQEANNLASIVSSLNYTDHDFGEEIDSFNFLPENSNNLFSSVLKMPLEVIEERSGIFRRPKQFIHFENFSSLQEWIFVVAVQESIFNLFEHVSGATCALDEYKFNYRNLFEWDLKVNYILAPGQGIFFRPWLFHSFDTGIVQLFNLKQV